MQIVQSQSARRGAVARGCLFAIGGILLLALVFGGCSVGLYNGIQVARTDVDAKWAAIDSTYKRRADLVPQLVDVVKGAANYEKSTLQAVIDARASVGKVQLPANALTDEKAMKAYLDAQAQLGGALKSLIATAEAYPDLKASKNFLALQDQIEGTENRIAVARTDYINSVQVYNTKLVTFPANLFATLFHFEKVSQFQTDAADRTPPKIDFGDGQKK